jgi:hypothetical protein
MTKNELLTYLNANTKGKCTGRKEFKLYDIFISDTNQTSNFRLTTMGKDIMSKHFDTYNITLYSTKKGETGSQVIELDRYMISPYYLRHGKLIIFEESLAAEFTLLSGDFDLWIQNKKYMPK